MKCTRLERVDAVVCSCYHLFLTDRTTAVRGVLERHGWPAGDRSKPPHPFVRLDSWENDQLVVHSKTEISPLIRLELLARSSHLLFLAAGRWDGVPTKSWTLRPVPHLPFQPSPILRHLCAHAGYECADGRGALMRSWCVQCGTFVRTYIPTYAISNAIRFTRTNSAATISRQGQEDGGPRAHHGYAAPARMAPRRPRRVYRRSTRSVPSLARKLRPSTGRSEAPHRTEPSHVPRAPALRVGSSEAGAQPRPVLALLCSADSRIACIRRAGFLSLPRNAQHSTSLHWSDQENRYTQGSGKGGIIQCTDTARLQRATCCRARDPTDPQRPRAGSRWPCASHHEVSQLSSWPAFQRCTPYSACALTFTLVRCVCCPDPPTPPTPSLF